MTRTQLGLLTVAVAAGLIYLSFEELSIAGMKMLANNGDTHAHQIIAEYHNQKAYQHTTMAAEHYQKALAGYMKDVKIAQGQEKAAIEFILGTHYECGKGIQVDLDKAKEWYLLSSKDGSDTGDAALTRLRQELMKRSKENNANAG